MSFDASAKGKAVVSSAGMSGEAAVGPPTRPDLQSVSEEKCAGRIQPLSGKPYFTCIMCKSHIQPPFQVVRATANHVLRCVLLCGRPIYETYTVSDLAEVVWWALRTLEPADQHLLWLEQVVPKSLAPFLPPSTVPATLTWRGRSWDMRFTGGRQIQRLEAGWRGFALDNGLRLGDGCVFELLDGAAGGGTVKFIVQVLRADIPPAIRERAGGYTSSSPIEID
ncbi:hypothetical protein PR202_gb22250 [Eleusine coracana subsp. coracana]|uniref:TF-B3 domain-containing protein n=1 Tax=Eleusine coracana subsp. coracana TaxID=191504 RepID=A0AAV5FH75_ELECO|nr:hypothetical protein PR202_gb22250 [Eleusine coracana subsp. coracana]